MKRGKSNIARKEMLRWSWICWNSKYKVDRFLYNDQIALTKPNIKELNKQARTRIGLHLMLQLWSMFCRTSLRRRHRFLLLNPVAFWNLSSIPRLSYFKVCPFQITTGIHVVMTTLLCRSLDCGHLS